MAVDLGKEGMAAVQDEHAVGAPESHQAGQLQLQAEHGEKLLMES